MSDVFDPLEPSPYKVLNIAQDATVPQIRTAHRKLVLQYHPDKVQNESEKAAKTERFQEIQHAYEVLQDEKRRARWDKRAADRDRQMEDRRMPRKASAYTPTRPSHGPVFENRDGVILEERVPRYARNADPNLFDAAFASESASKSSRKWHEGYEEPSSRRASGRGPEPKTRYKDMDSDIYAKTQEKKRKDEARSAREEAQKKRDKAKRQDKQASFSRRTRVDEYDDSDDHDDRHYSSKSDSKSKRKPADSHRYREDTPRRGSRRSDRVVVDEELESKIFFQQDYLNKSRVEPDNKRQGRARADSYSSHIQQPTPPPTPRDRDSGRRSSGDDGRKSSARARRPSPGRRKTYKNIDIVDPPVSNRSRIVNDFPERTLPREKTMPSRARTTYDADLSNFSKPAFKRAETMPIHHMASAADPRRAPKPRDPRMFDVDSSDESTSSTDSDSEFERLRRAAKSSTKRPPARPTQTTYSFKVSRDDDHPPTVIAEPDLYDDRSRDNSPKSMPRRSNTDRYAASAATRSPLAHSATFQGQPSPRASESRSSRHVPSLRATQSARDHPHLFGAIDNDEPSPRVSSSSRGFTDPRIRSGRDMDSHSRRASEDVRTDYSPRTSRMDSRRQFSSREIPAR